MNYIQEKISKNLRNYREAKNISQSELAGLLDMSSSTISSYEIGRAVPSLDILVRIAYLLEASIDEMLELPYLKYNEKSERAKIALTLTYIDYLTSQLELLRDNMRKTPNPDNRETEYSLDTSALAKWNEFVCGGEN